MKTEDGRLKFVRDGDQWTVEAAHIADTAALIASGLDQPSSSPTQLVINCRAMLGTSTVLLTPKTTTYHVGDSGITLTSDGEYQPCWTISFSGGEDARYAQAVYALDGQTYQSAYDALSAVRSSFESLTQPASAK